MVILYYFFLVIVLQLNAESRGLDGLNWLMDEVTMIILFVFLQRIWFDLSCSAKGLDMGKWQILIYPDFNCGIAMCFRYRKSDSDSFRSHIRRYVWWTQHRSESICRTWLETEAADWSSTSSRDQSSSPQVCQSRLQRWTACPNSPVSEDWVVHYPSHLSFETCTAHYALSSCTMCLQNLHSLTTDTDPVFLCGHSGRLNFNPLLIIAYLYGRQIRLLHREIIFWCSSAPLSSKRAPYFAFMPYYSKVDSGWQMAH